MLTAGHSLWEGSDHPGFLEVEKHPGGGTIRAKAWTVWAELAQTQGRPSPPFTFGPNV